MASAADIIRSAEAEVCHPLLRHVLTHAGWEALAYTCVDDGWVLLAHWADADQACALFLDLPALMPILVSTPIEAGHYPALSPPLPSAARYERLVRDLWGHHADGATDTRPWLDHGHWPLRHPMAARHETATPFEPPALSEPDRDDAMLLPLGPIRGRLDEAAHLRLTLHGPVIHHAEAALGFTHKGTLSLMRGKSPRTAARFAARLSADATVAHAVAFAQAAEAALDVTVPPRAAGIRILMMEIERIAVHLDNLAEVGRLAGSQAVHTECGYCREMILRASDAAFGHRLMMDCVVPGGVVADITECGTQIVLQAFGLVAAAIDAICRLHQRPALSARLDGVGRVSGTLAAGFGAGGVVGRAAGYRFDARTAFAPGYEDLAPLLCICSAGDAAARQQLRILEIKESLRLARLAIAGLPDGPVTVALPQASGEGIACAESHRGDVWHWMRLDHGQITASFARDPGWALWPLAEAALRDCPVDDVDLVRTSLALPASGVDL